MSAISRHYVLAAGGTGGHMMPAHALAEELLLRGHRVALITDDRGARIPGLFDNVQVHVLPAGRLSGGPLGWLRAARAILTGRAMALRLYETFRPAAVIGFGGYPALPALLAARRDRIPTVIHEQNAVLGRVNRLVASKVDAIATAYPAGRAAAGQCRGQGRSWSAIRCATRCWRCATSPSRRSPTTASSACWSPAAARARRSCPRSCRRGCRCCPSISAAGCR